MASKRKWLHALSSQHQAENPEREMTERSTNCIFAIRVEAIASRVEAIALRVEATASRVEAIARRVEAIALRVEAIALRVETIAVTSFV